MIKALYMTSALLASLVWNEAHPFYRWGHGGGEGLERLGSWPQVKQLFSWWNLTSAGPRPSQHPKEWDRKRWVGRVASFVEVLWGQSCVGASLFTWDKF